MNQDEQRFAAIKGVIDRVLWTAGATEANRKLLADAISDELAAYTAAVEAKERERCAITAWTIGMDEHTKARGMSCDAREVGAIAAREIRSL